MGALAAAPFCATVMVGAARRPEVTSDAVTVIVTLPALAGSGVAEATAIDGGVLSTVKATLTGVPTLPTSSVGIKVRVKLPSPHWVKLGPLVTVQVVGVPPGVPRVVTMTGPGS